MRSKGGAGLPRSIVGVVSVVIAASLAGCATQPTKVASKQRSKEYFAESEYGVKASPRVSMKRSNLPRGGGRDQVGKPYKVKGQWYHPKEEPGYAKVGAASWYGDAFHGRLTANGEVYDMTHLTAAHPTMPLPSYARVTNLSNGTSVVVRVNDRGPFAHGRVIDLSKRAAQLLDYTHHGVAKVKVEYVGRAPLHGQDDQYLMASFTPGRDQSVPQPSVMIAMSGSTPSGGAPSAVLASLERQPMAEPAGQGTSIDPAAIALPAVGPVVPERPADIARPEVATASHMSVHAYADMRVARAAGASAFAALDRSLSSGVRTDGPAAAPKSGPSAAYVAVGTFATRSEAEAVGGALSAFGDVAFDATAGTVAVTLVATDPARLDAAVEAAWAHGAPDAFVVRD